MYLARAALEPTTMIDQTNLLQKCKIQGLKLTPNSVRKVKKTIEYNFIQLDSLLIFHQEKFKAKLIDEKFFYPGTLAVLEYKGQTYAVEKA